MSCTDSERYISRAEGNISLPVTFVLATNGKRRLPTDLEGLNVNRDMELELDAIGCKQKESTVCKRPNKLDLGSDDEKVSENVGDGHSLRTASGHESPSVGVSPRQQPHLCALSSSTPRGSAQYPLIYVAPTGNMSVLLQPDTVLEVAVDKALRVICQGKFAAAVNSRGSSSCIMHQHARIYQEDTRVFCQFGSKGEKKAVFGSSGVLFAMAGAADAYLVSASSGGTTRVPFTSASFPTLEADFSIPLFFLQSEMGEHLYALCSELVANSHYDRLADGTVVINLHGVHVRHRVATTGEIDISCRPRHVRLLPHEGKISVRSHYIDMGVVEADKFFVKRGVKRVHVSKSGIVASDGNCVASIDDHGQLVSNS